MAERMTTYNTGNPLGSVDVRDLYDNAQNADNFSNGPLDAYPDRFGVSRQSLQGIRNASQYVDLGPYGPGLNFTARNQVFSYLGELYAPGPSITLPYTTTGAGAGEIANFRSVGDAILRQDLLASDGAERVGYGALTVAETLDAIQTAGKDIFILSSGQSNMPQDIPYVWTPEPNLFVWNFNGNSQASTVVGTAFLPASGTVIGPSIAAANAIAKKNPTSKVYVLNVYRGGLGIINWGPTPPDYNFRQAISGNIVPALAAAGMSKIDYFIFGACESDANAQSQTLAGDVEVYLMAWFTSQSWASSFTPFYLFGMSPWAAASPGNGDYLWRRYNGALRAVCETNPSHRAFVSLDDLPISMFDVTGPIPYIHRTGEGYYQSGLKMANAIELGLYEPVNYNLNESGNYTPVISSQVNGTVTVGFANWTRVGQILTVNFRGSFTATGAGAASFYFSVPVHVRQFPLNVIGLLGTPNLNEAGIVVAVPNQQNLQALFNVSGAGTRAFCISCTYRLLPSDALPNPV